MLLERPSVSNSRGQAGGKATLAGSSQQPGGAMHPARARHLDAFDGRAQRSQPQYTQHAVRPARRVWPLLGSCLGAVVCTSAAPGAARSDRQQRGLPPSLLDSLSALCALPVKQQQLHCHGAKQCCSLHMPQLFCSAGCQVGVPPLHSCLMGVAATAQETTRMWLEVWQRSCSLCRVINSAAAVAKHSSNQ